VSTKSKIRYIFASSNTSEGFFTFIPKLLEHLKNVYILKGPAGSGKSTLIRILGESIYEQGYDVEFWISAIDPVNPDGVYFPQLKIAVVNGSLPWAIDPKYPGGIGEIINLSEYGNKDLLKNKRFEIIELIDSVENQSKQAYELLKNANQIKGNIKKPATDHIHAKNLHSLTHELINEIIGEQSGEKHYFASAITADGVINYVDEISSFCKKRYVFKGPPGSGKSTVIKEIAQKAKGKGYLIEYYHCGLNVKSLSMVIIPSLQVALIDAGDIEMAVHPWDTIINMADYLLDYDIDSVNKEQSEAIRSYQMLIQEAGVELENASNSLKKLKKVYAECMDFELVDKKRDEIKEEILAHPGIGLKY